MTVLKPSLKNEWPLLVIMLVAIAAAPYFYLHFPDVVPTHWGWNGQPDGWSGKGFAAFFFPILIWAMYFLFIYIPKLDPRKDKYEQFSRAYGIIRSAIIIFMVAIYFLASLNGLGYDVPVDIYVPVGVGLLFIIIGNYLSKIKSNWFIGIRTPWTMSSEEAWRKTHRFGSKVFMISGVLIALSTWLPEDWQVGVFIAVIALLVLGTFGYSYYAYSQDKHHKE